MGPPSSAHLPTGMNGGALDYFQVVFTCLVFLALCPGKLMGGHRDRDGQSGGQKERVLRAGSGRGSSEYKPPINAYSLSGCWLCASHWVVAGSNSACLQSARGMRDKQTLQRHVRCCLRLCWVSRSRGRGQGVGRGATEIRGHTGDALKAAGVSWNGGIEAMLEWGRLTENIANEKTFKE